MTINKKILDLLSQRRVLEQKLEKARKKEKKKELAQYQQWYAGELANVTPDEGILPQEETFRRHSGPLRILAEGDSWFKYCIGKGIIPLLEDNLRVRIISLAEPGDEVKYMLSGSQRKKLRWHLDHGVRLSDIVQENGGRSSGRPYGQILPYDCLLFSGGGNDLVGMDRFDRWFKTYIPNMKYEDIFDWSEIGPKFAELQAGYKELISLRDTYSPSTKIFLHGYDFVNPNGVPAKKFGRNWGGPWMKPGLDERNIPHEWRRQVIKDLLLHFRSMLEQLQVQHKNIFIVDTQGTIQSDSLWENEMHPRKKGFQMLADKFANAIRLHT
jgi:hypothetical protein